MEPFTTVVVIDDRLAILGQSGNEHICGARAGGLYGQYMPLREGGEIPKNQTIAVCGGERACVPRDNELLGFVCAEGDRRIGPPAGVRLWRKPPPQDGDDCNQQQNRRESKHRTHCSARVLCCSSCPVRSGSKDTERDVQAFPYVALRREIGFTYLLIGTGIGDGVGTGTPGPGVTATPLLPCVFFQAITSCVRTSTAFCSCGSSPLES